MQAHPSSCWMYHNKQSVLPSPLSLHSRGLHIRFLLQTVTNQHATWCHSFFFLIDTWQIYLKAFFNSYNCKWQNWCHSLRKPLLHIMGKKCHRQEEAGLHENSRGREFNYSMVWCDFLCWNHSWVRQGHPKSQHLLLPPLCHSSIFSKTNNKMSL